jgi:hypothetical protein
MEFTHAVPVPNQARHVPASQADCPPTPVDRAAPDHAPHRREEQSHYIRIGLKHLPAVARRLYNSRQLGEASTF